MNQYFTEFPRYKILKLMCRFIMIKNNGSVYYAVGLGRKIGVYSSWKECKSQVDGISNAKFKKFSTLKEAKEFVDYWSNRALVAEKSENLKVNDCNLSNYNLECKLLILDSVKDMQIQKDQSYAYNPFKTSIIFSFLPVSQSTMSSEATNIDLTTISLRLDTFEKRFDAYLKEVGGILSDLNHVKDEIKGIKESIKYGALPLDSSKNKMGMLQTKLKFPGRNYDNENAFSFQYPSSSRFYSNSTDVNRDEPVKKKARKINKNSRTSNFIKSNNQYEIDIDCSEAFNFDERIKSLDFNMFNIDSKNYVHVYTDGACQANGTKEAKAGIGVWFGNGHPLNISESVKGSQTNNSAEIQAARVAIELATKAGVKKLKIFTDSEFLIKCATKWIPRWKNNNWTLINGKKVKNQSELKKLDLVASKITVLWVKVEGHSGVEGNEMADKLAKEGINKCQS